MQVRVVAEADWLPELESELDHVVARGSSPGPGDFADAMVVPLERAAGVLAAFGGRVSIPVVWVVPRSADQGELDRLSGASLASLFIFEPDPATVAGAVEELLAREVAGEAPAAKQASASMQELWTRFRGTMVERQEVLESVGAGVLEGDIDPDRLEEARHAAHKLHGSLGTFGLHRGSELAAELESLIEDSLALGQMDPGARYRYSELVVGLRREIDAGRPGEGVAGPDGAAVPDEDARTILLVEPDRDRLERLAAAAVARGWRPVRSVSARHALEWLASSGPPELAVLDPGAGDVDAVSQLVLTLAEASDPVPVVFQGRTRSLDERLEAVTLGARAMVDRDASPEAVMGRAESLVAAQSSGEARVLVVDDDPAVLRSLTFILRGAGLEVRTLESPLEFWRTLEAVDPDLVLLAVELPEVSGYQLCRAIRADPRWVDLPVLFLTARSDSRSVVAGFQAGGDDFVAKPLDGPELVARVESRLARRGPDGGAGVDRETGLSSRRLAMAGLEVQLALAARYRDPVTVIAVRVEAESPSAASKQLVRLSEELMAEARPEDVLARWGRTELLVSRYGEDAGGTRRWIERILPGPLRAVVGMAIFPDVTDAGALVERAVADLDRVAEAGEGEGVERQDVDIVIVEDDEAMGTLLSQTLGERGYRTHWLTDGAEAAERLAGPKPSLRASLIILDVGLPGLDGLSLLRLLSRDGITRHTRVVMLTARSAESEVVKALELGAFDHVPKPFSVSELVQRVRRAMGGRAGS